MNKENNILKWFNGEISVNDIKKMHSDTDFETLERIGFYSKQIDVPKIDAQKALEEFKVKKLPKKEVKVKALNFKTWQKVAAVLLVMITSSYFLFFNNNKSFQTQIAQTKTFNLPDNSEVILNAQSKLTYNKKDWKKNRSLTLDGEAFFKVSKGEKFTVNTDLGMVQVLGTQFNVKERAYYFEVQCYEGKVSVTYNAETVVLTQGKSFRVINGTIEAVDFNSENPSWLFKESSFDRVPLRQVIDELERQYDIVIETENVDLTQVFSGSFTHDDKNIALQSVTIPLKLSYRIEGKKVLLYSYEAN
ncbi:MAG TPA: FecR domain-containing protein [Flavobacteriaceae bacterium]|nr:FecR domain-containing protein [Flavobacteriaceae bacterium]